MSAGTPPRLLVISPNWIGDAVMAQPLLQLLRRQHPDSAIDVLAPGWVAPVWRAMEEVDTVIEAPFRHGALQLRERWAFARQLRRRGYGAAYVLPNTLKFALIPWLAGIAKRVGYRGEMRYGLLNVVHRDERRQKRPMVSFYAALAEAPVAIVPPPAALPRPVLSASSAQQAHAMEHAGLDASRPLLVFAPGAEFGPAKRWPAAHFAELANTVLARMPDMQIALLGSGKDRPVCDDIVALSPAVHNLAGSTSLDQAIALIAAARAVVSNDSGLMHIAAALDRAIVALFGPTDPTHTPPSSELAQTLWLHLECAPCHKRECPLGHHNCMRQMNADMVWQPLQRMLSDIRRV